MKRKATWFFTIVVIVSIAVFFFAKGSFQDFFPQRAEIYEQSVKPKKAISKADEEYEFSEMKTVSAAETIENAELLYHLTDCVITKTPYDYPIAELSDNILIDENAELDEQFTLLNDYLYVTFILTVKNPTAAAKDIQMNNHLMFGKSEALSGFGVEPSFGKPFLEKGKCTIDANSEQTIQLSYVVAKKDLAKEQALYFLADNRGEYLEFPQQLVEIETEWKDLTT